MSVYWVAMWTVMPDAIAEHDSNALVLLLDHVRSEHPRVLSARTWTVLWGAEPARPGRIWIEEFASLTSIDELENEEMGPACDAAWQAIHRLAVAGTFRTAIWTDPLRDGWKERVR
jgi:hypothetical protein